jgi:hypothetical protein
VSGWNVDGTGTVGGDVVGVVARGARGARRVVVAGRVEAVADGAPAWAASRVEP